MIASSERRVRAATLDDAAAINALYNPFIRNSVATFEEEEYDEPTRRRWLAARAQSLRTPVFVSETASGEIAGFANASAFDPREGYRTSVKTSVFVDAAHAGSGLGAALYEALFAALDRADLHRAYALIVAHEPIRRRSRCMSASGFAMRRRSARSGASSTNSTMSCGLKSGCNRSTRADFLL